MKKDLFLVLAIIVYGCQESSKTTTESLDKVEESVTEAYNRLCEIYSGTDVEKILDFYTEDIVRIPPSGQIIVGKKLLRVAKTNTRQFNIYTLDEYSAPVVLATVDQAVTYSTYKDTTISNETSDTTRTEGTWVAVWQKQSDNTWKIALSTYTSWPGGNTEQTIIAMERQGLDHWAQGDPLGMSDNFADDITYFDDIGAHTRLNGLEEMQNYLASLEIPPHSYELVDPKVQIYGDIAILTLRYQSTSLDGKLDPPWKATSVYRLIDSEWRVVHANWSMVKEQ